MDPTPVQTYINSKLYDTHSKERTREDLIQGYDRWAETYEQDIESKIGYGAATQVSDKVCEICSEETRHLVRILDVGAGTGILGKELKDHGFVHIDALDPSEKMLNEARKRNLYENYFCEFITGDPLDTIEKETYDFVTGVGMLGANHAPFSALHEMVRVTKPGGHILLAVRRGLLEWPEYKDLEPLMNDMELNGKWRMIHREIFSDYYKSIDGVLYCFCTSSKNAAGR